MPRPTVYWGPLVTKTGHRAAKGTQLWQMRKGRPAVTLR